MMLTTQTLRLAEDARLFGDCVLCLWSRFGMLVEKTLAINICLDAEYRCLGTKPFYDNGMSYFSRVFSD